MDLCRDHALEVAKRSPDNPVNPRLFTEDEWKALQKARTTLAEKVTHKRHGQLSMDPKIAEEQLIVFEREIIERGWRVQGKESCRLLWGLLTDEHRGVLRHASCYHALCNESFTDETKMTPTGGFTALRTHFGGPETVHEVGANLAANYQQRPNETLRALLERVKRHFSKDLNPEWDSWPRAQRRNLVTRFLRGMTRADYNHTSTPKDLDDLAARNWPDLVRTFVEMDHVIGPRARHIDRTRREVDRVDWEPLADPTQATNGGQAPPTPGDHDRADGTHAARLPMGQPQCGSCHPAGPTPTPEQTNALNAVTWTTQRILEQTVECEQVLQMIQQTEDGIGCLSPAQGNQSVKSLRSCRPRR